MNTENPVTQKLLELEAEAAIREVAARFGAADCVRFDAPLDSYPHFLTKILPPKKRK